MVEQNSLTLLEATQLIPINLQESTVQLIKMKCIPVKDGKQIPSLLAYFQKHSPLTEQLLSDTLTDQIYESENVLMQAHLFGKFRVKQQSNKINLAHLKRIRNHNGEISMLAGTPEMCEQIDQDKLVDSFEIDVPSKMLYQRHLYDKYVSMTNWPMNFNTQPSGFEFVAHHQIQVPSSLLTNTSNSCDLTEVCLLNSDFTEVLRISGSQQSCAIDHPIMLLAQKLGEQHLNATQSHDDYFMKGRYLVTTVEPCFMCAMALVHSRISRIYFLRTVPLGTMSHAQIFCLEQLNHSFLAFQLK